MAATTLEDTRQITELAVQRAIIATETVRRDGGNRGDLGGNSPLSIADYAAQALLIAALHEAFPGDDFIAEENALGLRTDPVALANVWNIVSSTRLEDEVANGRLGRPKNIEDMLRLIDLGSKDGTRSRRVWTIDPIDGTRNFLRGGQYTVVAALLEDNVQQVGVVGCPLVGWPLVGWPLLTMKDRQSALRELTNEAMYDGNMSGCIVSAIRGGGSQCRPLARGRLIEPAIPIPRLQDTADTSELRFADKLHSKQMLHPERHRIAAELGASRPWCPAHISSTQLKYVASALGLCHVAWRLTRKRNDYNFVWDHAGGMLIFEEVGGYVTDLKGNPIDFASGRELTNNVCVLAAPLWLHGKVLEAARYVLAQDEEYALLRDKTEA